MAPNPHARDDNKAGGSDLFGHEVGDTDELGHEVGDTDELGHEVGDTDELGHGGHRSAVLHVGACALAAVRNVARAPASGIPWPSTSRSRRRTR